jgi:hypothetical protein
MISDIHDECEICKVHKKTPSRPVVAMPMATKMNQRVSMDLKKWRDRWILQMVDMWSRFSISISIHQPKATE